MKFNQEREMVPVFFGVQTLSSKHVAHALAYRLSQAGDTLVHPYQGLKVWSVHSMLEFSPKIYSSGSILFWGVVEIYIIGSIAMPKDTEVSVDLSDSSIEGTNE